jgi:hypothetical protein
LSVKGIRQAERKRANTRNKTLPIYTSSLGRGKNLPKKDNPSLTKENSCAKVVLSAQKNSTFFCAPSFRQSTVKLSHSIPSEEETADKGPKVFGKPFSSSKGGMIMPGIEVSNLVKTYRIAQRESGLSGSLKGLFHRKYRVIRALDGISLSIKPGELVGYIGPNGAGKSTTVKVLSGILVPDSGSCRVNGRIPWEDRKSHVARIGTVFGQKTQLWWDLPVKESFDLLKEIYRVPGERYKLVLGELSELFNLAELYKTPCKTAQPGAENALRYGGCPASRTGYPFS